MIHMRKLICTVYAYDKTVFDKNFLQVHLFNKLVLPFCYTVSTIRMNYRNSWLTWNLFSMVLLSKIVNHQLLSFKLNKISTEQTPMLPYVKQTTALYTRFITVVTLVLYLTHDRDGYDW